MERIARNLAALVGLVGSMIGRHRIGPRVWITEAGHVIGDDRHEHGDEALALQMVAWGILCSALDEDASGTVELDSLGGLPDVRAYRCLRSSGRWALMIEGGAIDGVEVIAPGGGLIASLDAAGADLWVVGVRLRMLASARGVELDSPFSETVARGE